MAPSAEQFDIVFGYDIVGSYKCYDCVVFDLPDGADPEATQRQ